MHGEESHSQASWIAAQQRLWATLSEQLQGLGGEVARGTTDGASVASGGLGALLKVQLAHLANLQDLVASASASDSSPGTQASWTRLARQAAAWLPDTLGPAFGGLPGLMASFPGLAGAAQASGPVTGVQNPDLLQAWTILATEWAMMLADGQRRLDDAIADESEDVTSYRRLHALAVQSYDAAYDAMVSKRAYRQAFSAFINGQAIVAKRVVDRAVAAKTRELQQRVTELEQALQTGSTAAERAKTTARQSCTGRRKTQPAGTVSVPGEHRPAKTATNKARVKAGKRSAPPARKGGKN